MAHKKAGGSSRNGRNSPGQRLGVKRFDGEHVLPGAIIMRQRGTHIFPGSNVGLGRDYTLFSLIEGRVKFEWQAKGKRRASVYPPEQLVGNKQ